MAKFKRILLKLSGESLMGKQSFGIDPERLSDYAKQIKEGSGSMPKLCLPIRLSPLNFKRILLNFAII